MDIELPNPNDWTEYRPRLITRLLYLGASSLTALADRSLQRGVLSRRKGGGCWYRSAPPRDCRSADLSIEFRLPIEVRIIMRLMIIARACGFERPMPALGDWCLARGAWWRSGKGKWYRTSMVPR